MYNVIAILFALVFLALPVIDFYFADTIKRRLGNDNADFMGGFAWILEIWGFWFVFLAIN